MTNREKLQEVLRLLAELRGTLNQETTPCCACGLNVKQNWSESQAAETLRGGRAKLERLLEHRDLQPWLDRR